MKERLGVTLRAAANSFFALATQFAFSQSAMAQTQRVDWTLCTPNDFVSCHSISLVTRPITFENVRTGTDVFVSMTNLGGSGFGPDNTIWSGLDYVTFWGPNAGQGLPAFDGAEATLEMVGVGASGGNNPWKFEGWIAPHFIDRPASFPNSAFLFLSQAPGRIGGCRTGDPPIGLVTAFTCGGQARAQLSFGSDLIFDASRFSSAEIFVIGEAAGTSAAAAGCASSSSVPIGPRERCTVLGQDYVEASEPSALLLVVASALAIAAIPCRRDRQT
jgi:hypothetical protein